MAESGNESETDICEVQRILKRRQRRGNLEYLIRWKGFDPSEDSWEPEEHLIDCKDALAEFNLRVDKAKILHLKSPPPTPKQQTKSVKKKHTTVRKTQNSNSHSATEESSKSTTGKMTIVSRSPGAQATLTTQTTSSTTAVAKSTVFGGSAISGGASRMATRTPGIFGGAFSSASVDVTPYIRPVSELRRPSIKSHHMQSTGKVHYSEKSVRRTLDLKEPSFCRRHRCLLALGVLLVVMTMAVAVLMKVQRTQ